MSSLRPTRTSTVAFATLSLLLTLLSVGVVEPPSAGATILDGVQFDPERLDPQPLWTGGVTNPPAVSDISVQARPGVWDFAEIGDRIFVGGQFPTVKPWWDAPEVNQSFLAAFDRDTGQWISTFRPNLNDGVFALDVTETGQLLVGGRFTQVNGVSRTGLVALEPDTGAIDPNFGSSVARWYSNDPAIVREFERVGNDLYVVGDFDHVVRGGNSYRVWSATRLRANSGQLDPSWLPKVRYGAWDIAVDEGRGRVHLSGNFDSIDFNSSQLRFGTVSIVDGSVVGGLNSLQPNFATQSQRPALTMENDRLFVGGSQHVTSVLRGSDNAQIGFYTWGTTTNGYQYFNSFGGGDVQVAESVDGWVLTGCHCWNRSGNASQLHYSSFTGQRTGHTFAGIYDAGSLQISNFIPNLRKRYYGTWAIHVDVNGCLYLGGDYTGAANGQFVGGFAKFCGDTAAPTVSASSVGGDAVLTWTQSDAPGTLPIETYRIKRNGATIAVVGGNATTYTDTDAPVGTVTYTVEATDTHGRRAAANTSVNIVAGPTDTQDPSSPTGVDTTTNQSSVTITWDEASDNVGVVGYLVHDTYQYLAYVAGAGSTSYTHSGLVNGSLHRYQVRAKDAAGNTSIPSVRLDVTVGQGVRVPDNLPLNVSATQTGAGQVLVDWDRPTNPGGIRGYLVHDNYQYLAYHSGVDTTSYTHSGLAGGSTHRYQIRSQGDGVTSLPTERVVITLN